MKKISKGSLVCLVLLLSALIIVPYGDKVIDTATTNGKKLPIYCVEREDKVVALTFDAAWGDEDLDDILKILSDRDIKVTFFVTGDWVDKYPEAIKKIAEAGHDLGNHGDNHKHMSQLSKEESIKEIEGAHKKVKELTDIEMNLFRPPYGDYNNTVLEAAESSNYYSIQWDVDSLDWKNYGVDSIIDTVVNHKKLGNGTIILMHNGTKYTKDALEDVVDGVIAKGYKFIPVSEIIHSEEYELNHEGRQIIKK